jgi:hypothetical protein
MKSFDELYKWAKKRAEEEEKSANTWPEHSEQRSYRSGASNAFLEVFEKIDTIKTENLTLIPKPLIIDKSDAVVRLWNCDKQEYIHLTFEVIEDLYNLIKK